MDHDHEGAPRMTSTALGHADAPPFSLPFRLVGDLTDEELPPIWCPPLKIVSFVGTVSLTLFKRTTTWYISQQLIWVCLKIGYIPNEIAI